MQQFQQNFLPEIFHETWLCNTVKEIGENVIFLFNNDPFMVPFSRIAIVAKMPLFSFPANWEKFPDENIKFTRNKLEFNEKLKTYFIF
jgi:hypothetical protein